MSNKSRGRGKGPQPRKQFMIPPTTEGCLAQLQILSNLSKRRLLSNAEKWLVSALVYVLSYDEAEESHPGGIAPDGRMHSGVLAQRMSGLGIDLEQTLR